jgi:hypothetical protein
MFHYVVCSMNEEGPFFFINLNYQRINKEPFSYSLILFITLLKRPLTFLSFSFLFFFARSFMNF